MVSLAQGTFRLTLKVETLNQTVSPRVTTDYMPSQPCGKKKIQTASASVLLTASFKNLIRLHLN